MAGSTQARCHFCLLNFRVTATTWCRIFYTESGKETGILATEDNLEATLGSPRVGLPILSCESRLNSACSFYSQCRVYDSKPLTAGIEMKGKVS